MNSSNAAMVLMRRTVNNVRHLHAHTPHDVRDAFKCTSFLYLLVNNGLARLLRIEVNKKGEFYALLKNCIAHQQPDIKKIIHPKIKLP